MSRNILIIMVDQLNGTLFPDGPADWLHAPNLKALAARSTRFAQTYTASPLCAPARASYMSGLLPQRTRVYDNAAEFASDIPTYAHHLRRAGWRTCLSGKMHFVGPDQMHGFEDRLTTDIYPADFGWTPDYRKPGERIDWWYHNMGSVTGAGVAEITNQMEYDDEVTREDIRRARRAYFANISYLDTKVGELLKVLEDTRQEATILFVSDHGDMLGARGLWYKMSMFDGSSRVPLMICDPDMAPGRIDTPVSTIDVCPTLCDLAGVSMDEILPWTTGESLVPLGQGGTRDAPVSIEYAAEGTITPVVTLRYGKWKYTRCLADPDQLFDMEADPHELTNLADDPAHAGTVQTLRAKSEARWDLPRYDAEVRESQARRLVTYDALRNGAHYPWDFQPLRVASERYMRNHMDLNVLEEEKRFPRGE